jgi:hypothetical protein
MPAVTDPYATATTYRGIFGKSDTGDDAEILLQLTAVSRYVERKLGRFFTQDAAVVPRIFYPMGYFSGNAEAENPWLGVRSSRDLYVDDIATSTGLLIKIDTNRDGVFTDETALAATDFELRPLNADKGPEPMPWTQIHLPVWSTRIGWIPGAPIEITAKWGWPAVPESIAQAVCQLTGILRIESPRATNQISAGLDTVLGASHEAQDIVENLMKVYAKRKVFA